MMIDGAATAGGTRAYACRFASALRNSFFREAQGLQVSSLGLGTYLGEMNDATDAAYVEAISTAARGGINFLDSAINYRYQRSERCIGLALSELARDKKFRREEMVVCTKAGFVVPGAAPEKLREYEVVGGMHSMHPDFLADQLERSRANLGVSTIDVYYLHNPETQLRFIPRAVFENRIARAFEFLENAVSAGRIQWYGTATWEGYRRSPGASDALSLERMAGIARQVGGAGHHFRFIQLPFNISLIEAFAQKNQRVDGLWRSVLETAVELGITVVASAALMQARLTRNLPALIGERLAGPETDAQRAIQFSRSAPGITVALVGMSKARHVVENLGVCGIAPASAEAFLKLFRPAA